MQNFAIEFQELREEFSILSFSVKFLEYWCREDSITTIFSCHPSCLLPIKGMQGELECAKLSKIPYCGMLSTMISSVEQLPCSEVTSSRSRDVCCCLPCLRGDTRSRTLLAPFEKVLRWVLMCFFKGGMIRGLGPWGRHVGRVFCKLLLSYVNNPEKKTYFWIYTILSIKCWSYITKLSLFEYYTHYFSDLYPF